MVMHIEMSWTVDGLMPLEYEGVTMVMHIELCLTMVSCLWTMKV